MRAQTITSTIIAHVTSLPHAVEDNAAMRNMVLCDESFKHDLFERVRSVLDPANEKPPSTHAFSVLSLFVAPGIKDLVNINFSLCQADFLAFLRSQLDPLAPTATTTTAVDEPEAPPLPPAKKPRVEEPVPEPSPSILKNYNDRPLDTSNTGNTYLNPQYKPAIPASLLYKNNFVGHRFDSKEIPQLVLSNRKTSAYVVFGNEIYEETVWLDTAPLLTTPQEYEHQIKSMGDPGIDPPFYFRVDIDPASPFATVPPPPPKYVACQFNNPAKKHKSGRDYSKTRVLRDMKNASNTPAMLALGRLSSDVVEACQQRADGTSGSNFYLKMHLAFPPPELRTTQQPGLGSSPVTIAASLSEDASCVSAVLMDSQNPVPPPQLFPWSTEAVLLRGDSEGLLESFRCTIKPNSTEFVSLGTPSTAAAIMDYLRLLATATPGSTTTTAHLSVLPATLCVRSLAPPTATAGMQPLLAVLGQTLTVVRPPPSWTLTLDPPTEAAENSLRLGNCLLFFSPHGADPPLLAKQPEISVQFRDTPPISTPLTEQGFGGLFLRLAARRVQACTPPTDPSFCLHTRYLEVACADPPSLDTLGLLTPLSDLIQNSLCTPKFRCGVSDTATLVLSATHQPDHKPNFLSNDDFCDLFRRHPPLMLDPRSPSPEQVSHCEKSVLLVTPPLGASAASLSPSLLSGRNIVSATATCDLPPPLEKALAAAADHQLDLCLKAKHPLHVTVHLAVQLVHHIASSLNYGRPPPPQVRVHALPGRLSVELPRPPPPLRHCTISTPPGTDFDLSQTLPPFLCCHGSNPQAGHARRQISSPSLRLLVFDLPTSGGLPPLAIELQPQRRLLLAGGRRYHIIGYRTGHDLLTAQRLPSDLGLPPPIQRCLETHLVANRESPSPPTTSWTHNITPHCLGQDISCKPATPQQSSRLLCALRALLSHHTQHTGAACLLRDISDEAVVSAMALDTAHAVRFGANSGVPDVSLDTPTVFAAFSAICNLCKSPPHLYISVNRRAAASHGYYCGNVDLTDKHFFASAQPPTAHGREFVLSSPDFSPLSQSSLPQLVPWSHASRSDKSSLPPRVLLCVSRSAQTSRPLMVSPHPLRGGTPPPTIPEVWVLSSNRNPRFDAGTLSEVLRQYIADLTPLDRFHGHQALDFSKFCDGNTQLHKDLCEAAGAPVLRHLFRGHSLSPPPPVVVGGAEAAANVRLSSPLCDISPTHLLPLKDLHPSIPSGDEPTNPTRVPVALVRVRPCVGRLPSEQQEAIVSPTVKISTAAEHSQPLGHGFDGGDLVTVLFLRQPDHDRIFDKSPEAAVFPVPVCNTGRLVPDKSATFEGYTASAFLMIRRAASCMQRSTHGCTITAEFREVVLTYDHHAVSARLKNSPCVKWTYKSIMEDAEPPHTATDRPSQRQ